MCEQTEINYLDGDIVWVKLGSCWWPGQVTGFHNLPEDIQDEFKKKPLIAAVKFFQEDTYEFVKNYQQIYKYNCTLKDEFIKKGLDKYRSKSKDGSRYMDKFPGDVEMAEKLTGGDPEILSQDKFSPEEKPNIAALFGDKKVAKKKRERDDTYRRNSAIEIVRKITHPRFLKESDHEVRIRQQPSSLPSTPSSTGSPQYPCHLCSFTSSRINVIICHIKSHRSGNSPMARSKVKTYSQHSGRISDTDTPKRKYVKKEKSQPSKTKSSSESGKRKQPKQAEKASKKKKTDPKIRDTILADWDDESDEDISLNQSKSLDISSIASSPSKSQLDLDKSEESTEKNSTITDSNEIIEEAEKLLRETEKLTSINLIDDSLTSTIHSSKNSKESTFDDKSELEKDISASDSVIKESKSHKEEKESSNSDNETKQTMSDRDDKKSLLSCFDFHEEEPSIPPVRKKARVFHQKKEIIKEFELSQALKTEQEKEADSDKSAEAEDLDVNLKASEKSEAQLTENVQDSKKTEESDEIIKEDKQNNEINGKGSSEAANDTKATPGEGLKKSATNAIEGELEIVEIFKVDKEVGENGKTSTEKDIDKELQNNETTHSASKDDKMSVEKNELKIDDKSIDDKVQPKDAASETLIVGQTPTKDIEDTLSERFTTETEDETVSESAETLPEQSENSDVADVVDPDQVPNVDVMAMLNNEKLSLTSKTDKKGRSRSRKNVEFSRVSTSESDSPTVTGKKNNSKSLEKQETDRKTSESDSERSYTGRKRKPNKKYLESEIYVQSVEQKTVKTDESQSETDDKTSEMIKNKSRKNRKSMELDKKKAESTEYNEEKELKPSKTLDVAENKTNASKVEVKDKPIDTDIPKTIAELDIKLPIKEPPPEASEKSQDSKNDLESKDSGIVHGIVSEDTKSLIMESAIIDSNKTTSESEKVDNKEMVIDDEFNESKQNEEDLKDVSVEASNTLQLELTTQKEDLSQEMDISKTDTEMLPPKKSQIKKFELTQMDFFDTEASTNQISIEPEPEVRQKPEETMDVATAKTDLTEGEKMEKENVLSDAAADKKLEQIAKDIIAEKKEAEEVLLEDQKEIHKTETKAEIKTEKQDQNLKVEDSEQFVKDTTDVLHDQQLLKRTSIQTRYKGKFTPDTGAKSKKDKELLSEEKSTNTFQEAFLKTLHMDKKKSAAEDPELIVSKGKKGKKALKKKGDEPSNVNVTLGSVEDAKAGSLSDKLEMLVSENISNVPTQENNSQVSVMTNFEGIEVVVDPNLRIDTKVDDSRFQNVDNLASSSADFNIISKTLTQSPTIEDNSKSISSDMQKLDESSRMSASTPSPSSDVLVPVKKREMPRIIEAVTLSEPMQILKSKLLDKIPQKGGKHKLEMDSTKKIDQKSSPKAKVMKIESMSANSKMKTGSKVTSPHLSLTKKLQVLKAEEAEAAAAMDAQKEQLNVRTPKSSTSRSANEKYIQQSSQSLADMELDINSMPFVLSEDVLTPESIEQMPVVISSIIPASSSIPSTLSFTPTTQIVSPTQTQFKLTNESTGEISPTKKKSGTPAILKNKNKGKPTITSIKTLVPPLTGGVKGLKFQSTATGKTPPLLTQKGSPGKYVVVQTSGGQQLRYSVQGKSGTQQKIAIPTGKSAGNAQVVQQGGKVVILTSAQSGQSKMLPLNITKTLGGKVPRIITSKAQVYCPISPQSIISPKTIIAPKGDVSPTTSKLASGHNIINTQGIITSKGVLTPIPGTIAKTALLGTLSQGIITKDGIYTPISASALSGKIIGSKALVTKGATILSSQSLGTSKAILTPILSTQGIVSTKGTILTPITGQQVKAIAAKSPSKSSKVQYQSVQQKVQLPMLQKSQKVPLSSSSHGRSGQLKSAGSTVVLQNTSTSHKNVQHGKKVLKQTIVQQGGSMQNITAQGSAHQTVGMIPQIHQKGKSASTSTVQKVIMPHGGRQSKSAQQKIVVQKMQEPGMTKQSLTASSTTIPTVSKMVTQQKQVVSTVTKSTSKAQAANKTSQQQKNLLNIAMNSVTTTNVNATLSTPLALPPLEPIEPEKKSKLDNLLMETVQKEQPKVEKFNIDKGNDVEKVEEPKITAQPQIMALPTESSDGTQTYVLVTIDEQGQIQPLDNNTLMSLEGTTQNPDGTRTLYIDPSSLGEAGTLDNIVLQFDNGVLPNIQTSATDSTQAIISESFPTSEVIQTSNQDILAAALANTDFQQEINLPENPGSSVMTTGLTQTSLINQTILQSTIIPPTEPISSPSVLETSLTLNQPIMTPLEVPSNLPIQTDTTPTSAVPTIPSSLELPITITNPNISFIATGETQIQIPGNSMPDIGEIMDNPSAVGIAQAEIPASTQYLVLPNLEDNITVDTRNVQSGAISIPSVSYSSVSLSSNMGLQSPQGQTTPSMPIIDDTYSDNVQFSTSMEPSMAAEQTFVNVPVSEMLVSKASISTTDTQSQDVTVTSEMAISHNVPTSSQEPIVSTNEPSILNEDQDETMPLQEAYTSREVPVSSEELTLQHNICKDDATSNTAVAAQEKKDSNNDSIIHMQNTEETDKSMTSNMPIIDETSLVTSESNIKISPVEPMNYEVSDSNGMDTDNSQESKKDDKFKQLTFTEESSDKIRSPVVEEQAATSNEVEAVQETSQILPDESLNRLNKESMNVDESIDSKAYVASTIKQSEDCQRDEPSSQGESDLGQRNLELHFEETNAETSHETPSQSYDQFGISMTDSADLPSQSATKSENSREPSQSIAYEPMETDEEAIVTEPPTQSFEHSKINEASQSYETSAEASTSAPTQSFNELMQSQEERATIDEAIDDQTFPTQSYEVGKAENISENLETDAEISQEGNIPSQSNDIGTDGIGTSSVSTNNSGLNEDETASSSYVPETPENQERDQDQESAISTSSYEIPPCEELNIASSSVIPDTSVRAEHTSIHDNGVPEIPTSSYNLNPDITSTHIDSVPTSSYEDQVIVEQNVSTSYEVPISMPGLEETCSQNFVTESTDHRNEPSSYYAHHQEVTASYYESVDQETNSRLEGDPQEEVTPSYYEGNPQEASQSYFNPEEATPSYSSHNVSPSYYDPRPESEASQSYYSTEDMEKTEQSSSRNIEASQSYYSTEDMEKTEQSSSQNIEASQSFYQEQSDELKLRQQGEATPTYTERYPVDYTLDSSPIERHDLVESSVPATRPTERLSGRYGR